MAYANLEDVSKILPPDESMPATGSQEETNLLTSLEEATDLVIGYLGCEPYDEPDEDLDTVPDDVPPAVRRVVARIAMRVFLTDPTNPGVVGEVNLMGPFSHTVNWSKEYAAGDFYLTDSDKMRLDRYRCGGGGQVIHMPMAGWGEWYEPAGTVTYTPEYPPILDGGDAG